jgi:hypothetical protein
MEKDKLIRKLKTVKDPKERDRIMWALAGKEKDTFEEKPSPVQAGRPDTQPGQGQVPGLPKLPVDARKVVSYIAPALLIFFGMVNLLQAVMHYIETGWIDAILPQLIFGVIFLLFGFFSLTKARKASQGVNADKKKT